MDSKVFIKYIPHGVDHTLWKRYTDDADLTAAKEMKQRIFGDAHNDIKFVVLYNNRNIRRKMTGDVILAYKTFLDKLSPVDQLSCRLLLHTVPSDDNGTDLTAVLRDLAPNVHAVFSVDHITPEDMVKMYNNVDVVINLASNEGFGIGTLEAMLTERMFIANVTGGLQDQMGFVDDANQPLDADIHYTKEWGTNADGRYRTHGEWVIPIFPSNRALIGSPPTPYIFDDRCNYTDAADAIYEIYCMSPEERRRRGAIGREWALQPSIGMSSESMGERFISAFDDIFDNWVPRERFGIYKAN